MPPPGGSGSPPPSGSAQASVTSLPLDSSEQGRLYQAALNDTDVALLLRQLSEPGRLDPPRQSAAVATGPTTVRSIVLPVASYATGAVLAYVFFGATSESGVSTNLRAMVDPSGSMTHAGGGKTGASPRPEWNDVFSAGLFPEAFVRSGLTAAQRVAARDDVQLQICLAKMDLWFSACQHSSDQIFLAGMLLAVVCTACILGATGVIVITVGIGAMPGIYLCLGSCATAAGLIANAFMNLTYCNATAKIMIDLCFLEYQMRNDPNLKR